MLRAFDFHLHFSACFISLVHNGLILPPNPNLSVEPGKGKVQKSQRVVTYPVTPFGDSYSNATTTCRSDTD